MLVSRRAGALTAWGTAYLQGVASLDEADAETVAVDAVHRVVGVPGEADPVTVSLALARLRGRGVTALRLVLPEPGDPTGLPGSAAFNAAALAAGSAVLTVGPPEAPAYGMVATAAPSDHGDVVRWDVVEVPPTTAPGGLPTLSEADRALSQAMAEATEELAALDVARGRDEVTGRLARLDRDLRVVVLPSSLPARAQRLVATASRLLGILDLAAETDGAAVTSSEAARRRAALRPLRTAARYALCAGYSAGAEQGRTVGAR